MEGLKVGDKVFFGKPGYVRARGTIVKVNQKSYKILSEESYKGRPKGAEWRVHKTLVKLQTEAPEVSPEKLLKIALGDTEAGKAFVNDFGTGDDSFEDFINRSLVTSRPPARRRPKNPDVDNFRIGERVSFMGKGVKYIGTVIRKGTRKVSVTADGDGDRWWRVPPHMLTKVEA